MKHLFLVALFLVGTAARIAEVTIGIDRFYAVALQLSTTISAFFYIKLKTYGTLTNSESNKSTPLLLFILITVFANLFAQIRSERLDTSDMWRLWLIAFVPSLAYWATKAWTRSAFRARSIDLSILMLASACSISVFLDATGVTEYESYDRRHFGFMGDSVAWLLSLPIVYLTICRKYKVFNFLSIAALLLTQSLGASLVVVVGLFIYYWKSNTFRRQSIKIVSTLLMGLFIFYSLDLLPHLLGRLSAVDLVDNDRVRTSAFTYTLFLENPYVGGGYGFHWYTFYTSGMHLLNANPDFMGTPSSTYLQVLADTGLAGFLLFILFILSLSRSALRVISNVSSQPRSIEAGALASWLFSFMLTNHTAAWLIPSSYLSIIFFAVAGITAAFSSLSYRVSKSGRHLTP